MNQNRLEVEYHCFDYIQAKPIFDLSEAFKFLGFCVSFCLDLNWKTWPQSVSTCCLLSELYECLTTLETGFYH